MPKLFLPQTTLEEWVAQEKVDVREGNLHVLEETLTFPLTPAVHFTELLSGNDTHQLMKKVKTAEQLTGLSAEHVSDSVILGDDAYTVVSGYVTDVQASAPGKGAKGANEAELLAEFFLNKLS